MKQAKKKTPRARHDSLKDVFVVVVGTVSDLATQAHRLWAGVCLMSDVSLVMSASGVLGVLVGCLSLRGLVWSILRQARAECGPALLSRVRYVPRCVCVRVRAGVSISSTD